MRRFRPVPVLPVASGSLLPKALVPGPLLPGTRLPKARLPKALLPDARLPGALLLAGLLLGAAAPAVPTPTQIIAAAPADAWQAVAPENLLVMTLGTGQRVVIELAPEFAPVHVANIRALARAGWWDGSAIVRVQDDYVVQWARMPEGQALPPGVARHPPAEYDRPAAGLKLRPLGYPDAYASQAGFAGGWPVGSDGTRTWLAHCYGAVGVGRDLPQDTGTGEELYAVNGQAPRQLDRNIALVGRVVDGMPALGALPRGTGALGFYAEAGQRVPIRTVRVAADLPAGERPRGRGDARRRPRLRRRPGGAGEPARPVLRQDNRGGRPVQRARTGPDGAGSALTGTLSARRPQVSRRTPPPGHRGGHGLQPASLPLAWRRKEGSLPPGARIPTRRACIPSPPGHRARGRRCRRAR